MIFTTKMRLLLVSVTLAAVSTTLAAPTAQQATVPAGLPAAGSPAAPPALGRRDMFDDVEYPYHHRRHPGVEERFESRTIIHGDEHGDEESHPHHQHHHHHHGHHRAHGHHHHSEEVVEEVVEVKKHVELPFEERESYPHDRVEKEIFEVEERVDEGEYPHHHRHAHHHHHPHHRVEKEIFEVEERVDEGEYPHRHRHGHHHHHHHRHPKVEEKIIKVVRFEGESHPHRHRRHQHQEEEDIIKAESFDDLPYHPRHVEEDIIRAESFDDVPHQHRRHHIKEEVEEGDEEVVKIKKVVKVVR